MKTTTKLDKGEMILACVEWVNASIGGNTIWNLPFCDVDNLDFTYQQANKIVFVSVPLDVENGDEVYDAELSITLKAPQIRNAVSEYVRDKYGADMNTMDTMTLKKDGSVILTWSNLKDD